jgi:hypothetical protein
MRGPFPAVDRRCEQEPTCYPVRGSKHGFPSRDQFTDLTIWAERGNAEAWGFDGFEDSTLPPIEKMLAVNAVGLLSVSGKRTFRGRNRCHSVTRSCGPDSHSNCPHSTTVCTVRRCVNAIGTAAVGAAKAAGSGDADRANHFARCFEPFCVKESAIARTDPRLFE